MVFLEKVEAILRSASVVAVHKSSFSYGNDLFSPSVFYSPVLVLIELFIISFIYDYQIILFPL